MRNAGFEYSPRPNDFLKGKRCPKCANCLKLNTESFKEKIKFQEKGEEYTILEKYVDSDTPILFKHITCGNTFACPPKEFTGKKQRRCPFCNGLKSGISIGARMISDFLLKNNINFRKEARLIINNNVRRFDFQILDTEYFIEFDGIQHFKEGHFQFNTTTNTDLIETQKRDDEKNEFIIKNKKTLLRIPEKIGKNNKIEILKEFVKLNDQSKDVQKEEIKNSILEKGGLLVYDYPEVRYDLKNYRKIYSE